MKNFKQLVRELPSNKVVCAFGQFQPPTAGHELLVKAVQQIAGSTADHVIYASANEDKKLNPLPADRKVYFLKRMFSEANFQASLVESIVDVAFDLNKKYKHITVVVSSDKVATYEAELKEHNGTLYNFDSIKVVSCGDTDPDNNTVSAISGVKMCESAKNGNFNQFKKGVPHTLTELDSRRLMNDVRKGMGLDPIRETVLFQRSKIREQFVAGKIFNVGDRVQDENGTYEIMDRGTNYITVVNESGELCKKWIDKVTVADAIEENISHNPNEFTFKGYTTTEFYKEPRAHKAFKSTVDKHTNGQITDGVAVLNAIKHTDAYLSMIDGKDHDKAQEALKRIGEFENHQVYWDDHKPTVDSVIAHQKADQARAVKEESEILDKKKVALNYKEYIKKSMSSELPVELGEPVKGDGKIKPKAGFTPTENESNMEKDEAEEHTKVGHTLGHSRRQKIHYHLGESYDAAEKHLSLADKAQRNKDMFSHHMHMADHHDALSQWHDSKGRSSAAEKHAMKAADHEEIAHAIKNKQTVKESTLNPKDPHSDYKAKRKALQDLSMNKDVDQKHVQQRRLDLDKEYAKIKEDIYTADIKVKKVQVQDKDGNWVFKDRKSHPHRVNFGASKINGKPDLAKQVAAGEGAYNQQKEAASVDVSKVNHAGDKPHDEDWEDTGICMTHNKKHCKSCSTKKESTLNFESWVLKQKTTSSLKKDKKETEKASKSASGVEFKDDGVRKEEKEILKKKKKYKEINDKEVPFNNNTSAIFDPLTPTP
jgi:phosphopantetheine adenylyltransferase